MRKTTTEQNETGLKNIGSLETQTTEPVSPNDPDNLPRPKTVSRLQTMFITIGIKTEFNLHCQVFHKRTPRPIAAVETTEVVASVNVSKLSMLKTFGILLRPFHLKN